MAIFVSENIQIYKMRTIKTGILLMTALAAIASCRGKSSGQTENAEVSTITAGISPIDIDDEYSATIRGRQDIDIYPQVSGKIVKVCIKEGERVRKGQSLFIIDQVPYKAALERAKADVHIAQAQVRTARLEYESKASLYKDKVISEYELSMSEISLASAEAALEQAEANETDARNSLSYTDVTSPVDGVTGALPYREGTLVSPSMASPLMSVSDNSSMYVYFSMSENKLLSILRQYGSHEKAIEMLPEISLKLNDGTLYEYKGSVETISGVINPQTGSVSLRAVFPNPSGMLLSGGTGNIVITRTDSSSVVIPQTATFMIQDKIFVYKVVDGKAVMVEVNAEGTPDGQNYIIRGGLSEGEIIVSDGISSVYEGAEIVGIK